MRARRVLRALSIAFALLLLTCGGLAAATDEEQPEGAGDAGAAAKTTLAAADPAGSTSSVDPGLTFSWDPDAGFQRDGQRSDLPFDVQFYLELDVDDKLQSLSGRYVGDTSPLLCEKAFPRFRTFVDYGFAPRELAIGTKRQVHPMGSWRRHPKRDADKAKLNVVHGLLPNRHYCFEITKIRKVDTDDKQFQATLAKEIGRVLKQQNQKFLGDAIPRQTYEDLRQATIKAIESQLEANEWLVIPSGGFLDPRTETMSLAATDKRTFDDLIDAQSNRQNQIDNLRKDARAIAAFLKDLLAHEDLAAVREGLSAELTESIAWTELDPRPRVLEEIAEGTIDLKRAMAEQRGEGAAAQGERAAAWTDVWTAADLAKRKDNLASTIASLDTLQSLLGRTEQQAAEPQTPGAPAAPGQQTAPPLPSRVTFARNSAGVLLDTNLDAITRQLEKRSVALGALVEYITRVAIERLLVEGSTTADYETQFNWYLGLDVGVAWANDIEDLFSYFGTSIYFRPVNKKAPLSWSAFRRGQRTSELFKRLSITIGITIDDLEKRDLGGGIEATDRFQTPTQDTLISGVIGNSQLVAGLGFRLNRYFRVTAGVLVFKDRDPDPLIDRDELAWSPLLSVSIDFDVKSSLEKRFKR